MNIKKITILLSILLLFMFLIQSTGCVELRCAYIDESILTDGWYENTALRNTGTHFLGLEKWCSLSYEVKGNYPATVTVSSIKSLVLTDKEVIETQVKNTIENTFVDAVKLEYNMSGKRTVHTTHQTLYVIYDGIDTSTLNHIKIIGEVWNCASSGTSIICIGIAYITNVDIGNNINTTQWERIIGDEYGSISNVIGNYSLINHVRCH
jgi:hypothetical protein